MTTKKIKLNTWGRNYVVASAGQGEVNSRFLEITLVDETGDMTLADKEVVLYAVKPDGNVIYNTCTVENASNMVVSMELTSQMSSVSGVMTCEIHVMGSSQEVLKIVGLEIVIMECSDTSESVESTSEFTRLSEALSEVETLKDEYEALSGGSQVTIVQTTGTSTTDVMSQKAVTDALSESPSVSVVQTTGTSTTDVMSQKAVTDSILNPDISSGSKVRINSTTPVYSGSHDVTLIDSNGENSISSMSILIGCSSYNPIGNTLISIGLNSKADSGCIAIGRSAEATYGDSVSLGVYSYAMSSGVSIGCGITTYSGNATSVGASSGGTTNSTNLGYNAKSTTYAYYSVSLGANSRATEASVVSVGDGSSSTDYGTRRIVNVKDPTNAQDAATKNYVDSVLPTKPSSGTYTLKSIDGVLSWVSG